MNKEKAYAPYGYIESEWDELDPNAACHEDGFISPADEGEYIFDAEHNRIKRKGRASFGSGLYKKTHSSRGIL